MQGQIYPSIPYHPHESTVQGSSIIEPESGADRDINGASNARERNYNILRFEQFPLFKQLTTCLKRNLNVSLKASVNFLLIYHSCAGHLCTIVAMALFITFENSKVKSLSYFSSLALSEKWNYFMVSVGISTSNV